jgi:spore germination protein YaaH
VLALAARPGPAAEAASRPRLGAWVSYWELEAGLERVTRNPGVLDDVFFFVADQGADGLPALALEGGAPEALLRPLRGSATKAWLTVVNDTRGVAGKPRLKDSDAIHSMLAKAEARARHRRAIVELAIRCGFTGVDIDYENLLPEDRDRFSAFVKELSSDLSAHGLALSVTVQPKRRESQSVGPGAADWARLCEASDRVQVMLYNLHSSKTGPGPLADRPWIGEVMGYARSQCEAGRIVPVLKISGMDWGPGGVKDVTHADATALAGSEGAGIQRDPEGTPFFHYEAKDGGHTVYFEDATSILAKVGWLQGLGYDNVVLWSLGREDPALLPRLSRPR